MERTRIVKAWIDPNAHAIAFVKIAYDTERKKLSISGVVGPKRNGDCTGSAGQIDMDFFDTFSTVKDAVSPIGTRNLARLLNIWRRFHLNDMQAGCAHQRILKWDKEPWDSTKPTTAYIKHPDGYDGWNMKAWVNEKDGGYLGKPCPVCGYKYGTEWLKKDVPEWALRFLWNLPETDVQPAWI